MLLVAVFGIKSSGLNLAANLTILFLVVIWLALVYWTYADARRRIADPMLIGCATAASLFPFVGTIVYMIVRPPEYLDDVRERDLEMQAAEARLAQLGYHLCPYCDSEVEQDYLRCPSCMRRLKDPCRSCGRPLDSGWKICPYCESEVGEVATSPRRARRRREVPPERREAVVEARDVVVDSAAERRKARDARSVVRDPAAEPRRDGLRETATERPASEPQIT